MVPQVPDELAQLSLSGCSFEDTLDRNYFGVPPLCGSVTAPALPPGQVQSSFTLAQRAGDPLDGKLLEPYHSGLRSVVPVDWETVVAGI